MQCTQMHSKSKSANNSKKNPYLFDIVVAVFIFRIMCFIYNCIDDILSASIILTKANFISQILEKKTEANQT